jgi:uncharacterized protein
MERPTPEYKAFADADRLDALGAVGIARTFAFGGAYGRPIWSPNHDEATTGPYGASTIDHFYQKLLRLPDDMYTEPGRRIATQRVRVMSNFLDSFYSEWEGRDCEMPGDVLRSTETFHEGSGTDQQSHPSDLHLYPSA